MRISNKNFMLETTLKLLTTRFGSTNEIGIYEMNERGLQMVLNPSELFISKKESLEPWLYYLI